VRWLAEGQQCREISTKRRRWRGATPVPTAELVAKPLVKDPACPRGNRCGASVFADRLGLDNPLGRKGLSFGIVLGTLPPREHNPDRLTLSI
jgi:hypothetical protein